MSGICEVIWCREKAVVPAIVFWRGQTSLIDLDMGTVRGGIAQGKDKGSGDILADDALDRIGRARTGVETRL